MTGSTVEVLPSGAVLGGDVVGLNVRTDINDTVFEQVQNAWYEHSVLRFRAGMITGQCIAVDGGSGEAVNY